MRWRWVAAALLAALAGPAAADVALVALDPGGTLPTETAGRVVAALEQAGFAIAEGADPAPLESVRGGRVLVILAGQGVTTGATAWVLPRSARAASAAAVAVVAVPLGVYLDLAGPGGIVVVAQVPDAAPPGGRLLPGLGTPRVPEGTVLVVLPAHGLSAFVADTLLAPGADLAGALASPGPEVRVFGRLPDVPGDGDVLAWQEALAILGHLPVPLDGRDGAGTAAAIADWQAAGGYAPDGVLTPRQVERLLTRAAERGAALAAEARHAARANARADVALWRARGVAGDVAGLAAYLERFPWGSYAGPARAHVAALEAAAVAAAPDQERAAYRAAVVEGASALRRFVDATPRSALAPFAALRRNLVQMGDDPGDAAGQEASLIAAPGVARGVADRLDMLGLPGASAPRDAIAQYQSRRGLVPHGFLDAQTLRMLVAETRRVSPGGPCSASGSC